MTGDSRHRANWEHGRAQMLVSALRAIDPAVKVSVSARMHTATITLDLTVTERLIEQLREDA